MTVVNARDSQLEFLKINHWEKCIARREGFIEKVSYMLSVFNLICVIPLDGNVIFQRAISLNSTAKNEIFLHCSASNISNKENVSISFENQINHKLIPYYT